MKQLQNNIIITILFHTLGKTSTAIATKQGDELLNFLKEVLEFANTELEKSDKNFVCESPESAKENIKTLDNLYEILHKVFKFLFKICTKDEKMLIMPEYECFIDNLNELRYNFTVCADVEMWEEIERIHNGTYDKSEYVEYNHKTFWE